MPSNLIKLNKNIGLADGLFTVSQQRILGILFGQSHRCFYSNEIIAMAAVGTGAAQRELKRLVTVELITVTQVGNQKHYQASNSRPNIFLQGPSF